MRRGDAGFSVIELSIAMTLATMFMASFYGVLYGMKNEMYRQNYYYDTNRGVRLALDRISRDAKEATRVEDNRGGVTTGNAALVLRLPAIDAAGRPTDVTTQFDYVTYRLDPGDSTRLVRSLDVLNGTSQREGGTDATNLVIAKRIQSISFSSGGMGLSTLSAAAKQSLKSMNAQILTAGETFGVNQTTEADTDIMLRNQLT